MTNKTAIILNAPPHSGKDTIANLLVKDLKAAKQEFKAALYEATASYYCYPIEVIRQISTDRKTKDNLSSDFSNKFVITPREALIHVSEKYIKPTYGSAYFGKRAADRLKEGLNVFSDGGGWWSELEPVVRAADKVIVCRLYRHGFTFEGDSRVYYDSDTVPITLVDKISICDIHLEEDKPQAAVDAIKDLINTRK